MAVVNKASWVWCFKIKDTEGKHIDLKISCPIRFIVDAVLVVILDQSNLSSSIILNRSHNSELEIPLQTSFKPCSNLTVYVYGLKGVCTPTGDYDRVVCCGTVNTVFSADISPIKMELSEYIYQKEQLPLDIPTQGTLPVIVNRMPPSLYKLQVMHCFPTTQDFIIFVQVKDQLICFFTSSKHVDFRFPCELPSSTIVKCKIICGCRKKFAPASHWVTETLSHSQMLTFKTFLTITDNYRLYNLATIFGSRKPSPGLHPIRYFYRNKSVEYFSVILNFLGGEMRPYLKNNGGEQGSVLNCRLPGLFFSTLIDLNTNKPSPLSFYGPVRLYVNALVMFNLHCNLYFADFFCHYKRHHVTIVLAPKCSPCNVFCQQYLTQLNIFNNPYLCLQMSENGSFDVCANMDVTVDVFYTETINILCALKMNIGHLEKSEIIGRGYALPSGVPKNPSCNVCNL